MSHPRATGLKKAQTPTGTEEPKAKSLKQKKYRVPDDSQFVVILSPPFKASRRNPNEPHFPRTTDHYYERLVYWLRAIFDNRHIVTCVFSFPNNLDQVIVELDPDINIEPYLGVHYWREVLNDPPANLDPTINTKIFEYNFEVFGHPSKIRQWREHFPDTSSGAEFANVRKPYPRAHYCLIPSGGRDAICKPLPSNRGPTPPLPPPRTPTPPPAKDSRNAPTIKLEPVEENFKIGKLDPFEEEEQALSILRGGFSAGREPLDSSKSHTPGPQVQPMIQEKQIEALAIRTEEEELENLFRRRQAAKNRSQAPTVNVKREQEDSQISWNRPSQRQTESNLGGSAIAIAEPVSTDLSVPNVVKKRTSSDASLREERKRKKIEGLMDEYRELMQQATANQTAGEMLLMEAELARKKAEMVMQRLEREKEK